MATITRGYTFGTAELVNASKLHQLVDNASVSGLSADDFTSGVQGISNVSPASPGEGALWHSRETINFVSVSGTSGYANTFTEDVFTVQSAFGAVALFNPLTLETRRIVAGADYATHEAGRAGGFETGGGGNTLVGYGDGNGIRFLQGVPTATQAGEVAVRSRIVGFSGVWRSGVSVVPPKSWAQVLFFNGANAQFAVTSATAQDGAYAIALSNWQPNSITGRVPGWLLGGPLWKT